MTMGLVGVWTRVSVGRVRGSINVSYRQKTANTGRVFGTHRATEEGGDLERD